MNDSVNPSAVRSKLEITNALLSLMQKHLYSEITVKQIILEAKLARKTFYRNFDSKDDVLLSHINKILFEYFDIVNNARGDVLTTIFDFADKNRELLLLLDKNDMLYVVMKCMNEFAPRIRSQLLSEHNPFTKLFYGLDDEYLIRMNIGAVWNVITLWVHRGMIDDPEEVRKTLEIYLARLAESAKLKKGCKAISY